MAKSWKFANEKLVKSWRDIKIVENHSFTRYNNSHQIYHSVHPHTPTLPKNLFTLPQSHHHVIIGVKEYNRYYSNGSTTGESCVYQHYKFFYYTISNSHDKFEKFVWFCAVAFLKFLKQDKRKVDLNLALPNVLSQHSKTDWKVEIG